MQRTILIIGVATIGMAIFGDGQTPAGRPEFEVASIRPPTFGSSKKVPTSSSGDEVHDLRLKSETWSLQGLICTAYGIKPYQLVVPGWVASTYFDLEAKLPEGTTPAQVPLMLQTLLADRFGMKFHREKRPHTMQALVVAKSGLKLKAKKSEPGAETVPWIIGTSKIGGRNGMHVEMSSVARLAEFLSIQIGQPITDETQLKGSYNIVFDFPIEMTSNRIVTPPSGVASDPGGLPELIQEIEKLGFKLETRKDQLDFIVVEHLEKVATEN